MNINDLLAKLTNSYSQVDRELIKRAFRVADNAHRNQKRASGEPYINHCLAVASILADMHVPPQIIAVGLLHDTVEDTEITLDDLQRDFGDEIAKLVDAVTKLTTLPRVSRSDQFAETQEEQNRRISDERRGLPNDDARAEILKRSRKYDLASETLRKTFLAMAEDPRVVLIKLADRLHNMRTLHYMPENKQKRIAQETMDIFAPLANRLGIWQIKWELEDLSFRYLNPNKYKEIAEKLAIRRTDREKQLEKITQRLMVVMNQAGLEAEISGRPKHIHSIYKKMVNKGVPFDMVHDIRGVRIIVPDKATCYATLGVIHSNWRPIPGEFDDYIASPKENFYQSIHTAVVYDDGKTLEVQIRTPEMHRNAELGIAAHWIYKEGSQYKDPQFEKRVVYLRQLMEWRQDVDDTQEFLAGMKTDVFGDRVYAFTPRGDIIDLPSGATPIDFAYHVHTEVGHRCRGAKVNGRLVSMDHKLKTGDQVEILTAKRGGPSRDWLNPNLSLVNTQRARAKIKRWFKKQAREDNVVQGKTLLERELKHLGITNLNQEEMARQFEFKSYDDMAEAIGCGDLSLAKVVKELVLEEEHDEEIDFPPIIDHHALPQSANAISVLGLKGLLTHMARCCSPTPGDEIIGYITRGRGATIHRADCPNILRIKDKERLVKVSWGMPTNTFPVPVRIKAYDRDGLIKDVSTLIADENINMTKIRVDVNKNNMAVFDIIIEVRNVSQLSKILDRLESLSNVIEARRVRPG
ncbi:MAG: bifunctional (p)ppGpp synthetase/guanosine-3',5'-bis(diphosphate) 3'-pyrophosphohydrolase [Anaerolineales bacterium]|nr:bifunctional (p)ppGpp synthetase/guanosine-3',5'-bis(diphosphate) 3'-pyrophosphohydrolase [Anaerolineales bacterium]